MPQKQVFALGIDRRTLVIQPIPGAANLQCAVGQIDIQVACAPNGIARGSVDHRKRQVCTLSLQLKQLEQQADFYSSLYPESQIASLETVGAETFEGVECYNVKVTTTWNITSPSLAPCPEK